jgi:hypothetical protein
MLARKLSNATLYILSRTDGKPAQAHGIGESAYHRFTHRVLADQSL